VLTLKPFEVRLLSSESWSLRDNDGVAEAVNEPGDAIAKSQPDLLQRGCPPSSQHHGGSLLSLDFRLHPTR